MICFWIDELTLQEVIDILALFCSTDFIIPLFITSGRNIQLNCFLEAHGK